MLDVGLVSKLIVLYWLVSCLCCFTCFECLDVFCSLVCFGFAVWVGFCGVGCLWVCLRAISLLWCLLLVWVVLFAGDVAFFTDLFWCLCILIVLLWRL